VACDRGSSPLFTTTERKILFGDSRNCSNSIYSLALFQFEKGPFPHFFRVSCTPLDSMRTVSPSYTTMPAVELIRACADAGDNLAWEEFVARFRRPITLSVLRVASKRVKTASQVTGDLVQETYLKLCADGCRKLLEFVTQNPEAAGRYISTIAINVARDHFKSLESQKRSASGTDQLPENTEPQARCASLGGQAATERQILLGEIDRCLKICADGPNQERDCLIFGLHYQQGLSARAIAALPTIELTHKGVEAVIFRLTRMLREQLVGLKPRSASRSEADEKGFRPAES
jgi:RNA polymerase sigma-70 factor (ECF subfamily)